MINLIVSVKLNILDSIFIFTLLKWIYFVIINFKFINFCIDEETGCSVGDYRVSSRRRWNYENNCASIVCYVSTGLASSSTQLTDLSDDIIQRHKQLAHGLTIDNVNEILSYITNKLLRSKGVPSPTSADTQKQSTNSSNSTSTEVRLPAIHLKVFYQVR